MGGQKDGPAVGWSNVYFKGLGIIQRDSAPWSDLLVNPWQKRNERKQPQV